MRCSNVRSLIVPLALGELDPRVAQQLRKHLAGCDACSNELQATSDSLSLVRAVLQEDLAKPLSLGKEHRAAIFADQPFEKEQPRLRTGKSRKQMRPRDDGNWFIRPHRILARAALLIVALAGAFLLFSVLTATMSGELKQRCIRSPEMSEPEPEGVPRFSGGALGALDEWDHSVADRGDVNGDKTYNRPDMAPPPTGEPQRPEPMQVDKLIVKKEELRQQNEELRRETQAVGGYLAGGFTYESGDPPNVGRDFGLIASDGSAPMADIQDYGGAGTGGISPKQGVPGSGGVVRSGADRRRQTTTPAAPSTQPPKPRATGERVAHTYWYADNGRKAGDVDHDGDGLSSRTEPATIHLEVGNDDPFTFFDTTVDAPVLMNGTASSRTTVTGGTKYKTEATDGQTFDAVTIVRSPVVLGSLHAKSGLSIDAESIPPLEKPTKQVQESKWSKDGKEPSALKKNKALKKVQEREEAEGPEDKAAPATPPEPVIFNPFVKTIQKAISTFGIDVDTAAYTLVRNALRSGALPVPQNVRTEEVVNFFDYDDRAPDAGTFAIYLEGAPTPYAHAARLLRIGVKGRRLGREEQRPAVLTFLIDTSGSMARTDRLGLVQESLALLLDQLGPRDRVAIVQYDSRPRLVLEHTPASQKKQILAALRGLQCSGSTNLEAGMMHAYELAASGFVPGAENRVLLLSDGVANLGSSSAKEILNKVAKYRDQGITCSIFGVGLGSYNDAMLEKLANSGDGTYRYLDTVEEAKRVFGEDVAATLNTIAADVKIQVEFDPAMVEEYRQLGYENRQLTKEQFRDDSVDAGEVGSGQSVTALYELLPRQDGVEKQKPWGVVRIRYRRVSDGVVREVERPIGPEVFVSRFEEARPHFRLAACAAEFAEILRGSPHAAGDEMEDVARCLRPIALDLQLDTRVKELLQLVDLAKGMGL